MSLREAAQMALDAATEELPKVDERETVFCSIQGHHLRALCEFVRAALANEFNPDWDAMAVMVEEQQRMAKRIEELKERLLQVELNPPTARLAQPEPEPVAWYDKHGMITHDPLEGVTPLYTAPPQREWQGLTDGEVKAVQRDAGVTFFVPADYDRHLFTHMTDEQLMKVARAIEAKLKEKNND